MKKSDETKIASLTKAYQRKKGFAIAGKLMDETTKAAVSGAIIRIFEAQGNTPETLKNLTYSNKQGYFAIETSSRGDYVLTVNALGYESKDQLVSVPGSEKIVVRNVAMTPTADEAGSKILGQITDEAHAIIPLAEVILYSVTDYGGMVPVGYQKTDENGNYVFEHVPNGTYKVGVSAS